MSENSSYTLTFYTLVGTSVLGILGSAYYLYSLTTLGGSFLCISSSINCSASSSEKKNGDCTESPLNLLGKSVHPAIKDLN